MSSMLRSSFVRHGRFARKARSSLKLMSTQSSPDTNPPTALATLHLEDGTSIVGRSFGCHESVEGEVRAETFNSEHSIFTIL